MKKNLVIALTSLAVLVSACFLVVKVMGTSGVDLYMDGQRICEIENIEIAETAEEQLKEELSDGMFFELPELSYKYHLSVAHSFLNAEECKEKIMSTLTENFVRGYNVICDGKLLSTVSTFGEAEKIVERICEVAVSGTEYTDGEGELSVASEFEIRNVFCKTAQISSYQDAVAALGLGDGGGDHTGRISAYTVESSGDGKKNTDITTYTNGVITVSLGRVYRYTYTEAIPFSTEYVPSKKYYVGTTKVISEGVNGMRENVAEVIVLGNGSKKTKIISSREIVEPVNQIEYVGTKKYPSTEPTGVYTMPIKKWFTITTRYHERPRGSTFPHRGTDLACKTGTPVYAADGGVVILAEESGTYGLMVRIAHGEDIMTYYAHLSEIEVKKGDRVYKGQEIGKVGSTGQSTGPHLHFELLLGGQTVDPELYLPFPKEDTAAETESDD